MPGLFIEELEWSEGSEEHVGRHVDPEFVEQLVHIGDYFWFPNRNDHPPQFARLIGKTGDGTMLTAIVKPTSIEGRWVPVTAFWSSEFERRKYRDAKAKANRRG